MKFINRDGKITWREPWLPVRLIAATDSVFRAGAPAVIDVDGTTYWFPKNRVKGKGRNCTVLYPDEKIQPSFQRDVG